MLRVPRSRGALSGLLLVLLGAWGALIAFIGPYFHYAYSPDRAWAYTSGRFWLEILPGVAVLAGGLVVLAAATRPVALSGAWLAAMSGAWFAVGPALSTLWTAGGRPAAGSPVGGTLTRAVAQAGFFTGLGAVIIFRAALALGRFTVVGVREATRAAEDAAAADRAAADPGVTGGTAPAGPTAQPATQPGAADPAMTGSPQAGQRPGPGPQAAP
jgi:hypothetical protein